MDITLNKEIGKRIAELRKVHGFTQEYLGEKLNILKSTLASYETGRRALPLDLLIQLANIFKISTDDFLSLEFQFLTSRPGPKSIIEKQLEAIRDLPKDKQKAISTILKMALNGSS